MGKGLDSRIIAGQCTAAVRVTLGASCEYTMQPPTDEGNGGHTSSIERVARERYVGE